MTKPEVLGQLSGLHEMMVDLLQGIPSAEANARFHPHLASLSWYLGRCVYRELYWVREVLAGDTTLSNRVRHIFSDGDLDTQCAQLPPPDHLLSWAAEVQGEHLRRLATPSALPQNALLENDQLQWFLLQETARDYESMLSVLLARRLMQTPDDFRVDEPLQPRQPDETCAEITQGHYRIGSRDEPFAYDNELPPQAVELSSYRIAKRPVSNAEYLAFMADGGYRRTDLWDEAGQGWLETTRSPAPWHWRRDDGGHWYAIGLNGPMALAAQEPVSGINQHEARTYAAWSASLGGPLSGAILQHEYQWEVAARSGLIEGTGRVWEWCANPFHLYTDFTPFPDSTVSQVQFDNEKASLRGTSLHTQRCLRRASYRHFSEPDQRHLNAGFRLVLPPESS